MEIVPCEALLERNTVNVHSIFHAELVQPSMGVCHFDRDKVASVIEVKIK